LFLHILCQRYFTYLHIISKGDLIWRQQQKSEENGPTKYNDNYVSKTHSQINGHLGGRVKVRYWYVVFDMIEIFLLVQYTKKEKNRPITTKSTNSHKIYQTHAKHYNWDVKYTSILHS
jgi:hypothetical protein